MGRDSSVSIATTLRAGRSGDRIPVGGGGARFFAARPGRLYDGYRVFPAGKAAGKRC
jgi:hypothetical protein